MMMKVSIRGRLLLVLSMLAPLCAASILRPDAGRAAGICGDWEITPTPNVGNSVTRLTSVTALSASDAWSVGYWRNEPSGTGSLVIHWNGSSWGLVGLPSTSHLGAEPQTQGVDHAPNGDVWVVGHISTPPPTNNLPLVLRWRGGSWDYVNTVRLRPQIEYPFADRGGFAYEVDAITENDIWAVGLAGGYGDASASSVPMALHWDGSEWTDVDVPLISNRHHELSDLVAIASDDVWAVGNYRFIAGTFRGVTYHWDGTAWTHVPSPIEGISQSDLVDVAAAGPDDVWALGGSDSQIYLMHWDGEAWSFAEPPPHSVGGTIAAVAPNDLWVSGWTGFWHWNGATWTEVPSDVPGATYVIRGGSMEIVGPCDIWSVGFWTLADGITSFSLAERLRPDPASVADGDADGGADGDAPGDAPGDGPEDAPGGNALAFANPYRPGDPIRLSLRPASGTTVLTVHDVGGRTLRRVLLDRVGRDGSARWAWDGRIESGAQAPPGLYLVRLDSGGSTSARKLYLLGNR